MLLVGLSESDVRYYIQSVEVSFSEWNDKKWIEKTLLLLIPLLPSQSFISTPPSRPSGAVNLVFNV